MARDSNSKDPLGQEERGILRHRSWWELGRREFLKLGAACTAGLLASRILTGCRDRGTSRAAASGPAGALPTRELGRTGHQVSIIGLGGQAALEQPGNEAVAIPIMERALELGINYIDTAPAYGVPERWSQRYIGQVMKRRRAQVLLASKTHNRSRDGSLRLLEESLRLLETDHLDVWQIHNLSRMEEVELVFGRGGAMEALLQAREQKMVRFLGLTGHADPAVLMEALRRGPFDTILMALNAADKHHLSFSEALLPLAVEKGLGIIAMKVAANGYLMFHWKQLLRLRRPGNLTMRQALDYVLTLPVSTVVIGCGSVAEVEENVQLARTFQPLRAQQMADLEERTRPLARQALYFRRWDGDSAVSGNN